MRIAIPSELPGGLDAIVSPHFGHCDVFTLVDVEKDEIAKVEIMPNAGHTQGACMAPVMILKQAGVDMMVAGGMGMRPLAGFQQVGIDVYHIAEEISVSEAVQMIVSGRAPRFGPAQVCGGGDCAG
jgi:predicted Fe-Mo cluster-binding NifX family protein